MTTSPRGPREWWRDVLRSPLHVCSPMVDQSELAYRMLLRRRYIPSEQQQSGLLCYTPMLHASKFASDHTYRRQRFSTCPEEKALGGGLIAQFCGDNPETLLAAAKFVENDVDAVDLNLGCPQAIAQRGNYGAFLMRQRDACVAIVRAWRDELPIPCTAKVRLLDEKSPRAEERGLQGTINFCRELEAAGVHALTVHGRTRAQTGFRTGAASWESIRHVREALQGQGTLADGATARGLPVIANGGIETGADVRKCLLQTGADAVMSAEALLENPVLFNCESPALNALSPPRGASSPVAFPSLSARTSPPSLRARVSTATCFARDYLSLAREHPPSDFYKCVKAHCLKLLHLPLRVAQRGAASTGAGDACALVFGAENTAQLSVAIDALDAALLSPAPPQTSECTGDGAFSEGQTSCRPSGHWSKLEEDLVEEEDEEEWRANTWYRRHRDLTLKSHSGSAAGAQDAAQDRIKRKELRRDKYSNMGFRGLQPAGAATAITRSVESWNQSRTAAAAAAAALPTNPT
jgi:tRNA-dihydrouridine synthase